MHGFVRDKVCEELGSTAHSTRCEATVAMLRGEQLTVAADRANDRFSAETAVELVGNVLLRIVALTLPEFQKDVA
jgi:hypothetical protein